MKEMVDASKAMDKLKTVKSLSSKLKVNIPFLVTIVIISIG